MKRKVVGIALFCLLLLVAIFAGYWDMLNTEQVRLARDKTSEAIGGIAAMIDPAAPSSPPAAGSPGQVQEPPAGLPAPDAKKPEAPTFDVLRVEPDGSTIIAGKAGAGTTVRLVDGSTTLGEETAGPAGDFAIVLDKPLAVGEHQIRIEATGEAGETTTSSGTAIVSVPPRGRENELLAMVETPDQPSRLISVPTTDSNAAPASAAVSTAGANAETAPTPNVEAAPKPAEGGTVAAPATADDAAADAGTAPVLDPSASPAPVAGVAAAASPSREPSVPSAAPAGSASSAAATGAASPARGAASGALAVEAVEIEDRTIYVAGRAPEGQTVRIYVDNVLLGEDANRKSDRFLVTTTSDLPPGEHMVRADQLAADGTVLARVEVPFVKPEGRAMAAVAGASDPATGRATSPGAGDREEAVAASDRVENEVSPNSPTPTPTPDTTPTPTPTPASSEPEAPTPNAPSDAVDRNGRAVVEGALPDAAGALASGSATDSASADMAPKSTADDGIAPDKAGGAAGRPAENVAPTSAEETVGGANEPAMATNEPAVAGATPGALVETTRQAPLTAAGARVIIRRGDTLWRISRDTYGRGARYTTIYLANGDQIRDPDRIYPGQVFRVPDTAEGGTAVR